MQHTPGGRDRLQNTATTNKIADFTVVLGHNIYIYIYILVQQPFTLTQTKDCATKGVSISIVSVYISEVHTLHGQK